MDTKGLTTEQIEKVKGMSPAEVIAYAKEMGHDLTDDELEQVSGGGWGGNSDVCEDGGSHNFVHDGWDASTHLEVVRCTKCGATELQ